VATLKNAIAAPKKKANRPSPRRVGALPRFWWAWFLVLTALTAAAVLHVRSRLAVVQLGYELSNALNERTGLQAARRELLVEVATLRSPRRLRKLAVEQLGLTKPGPGQVLRLDGRKTSKLALGRPRDPGSRGE
jgi:cell division protein FtsL